MNPHRKYKNHGPDGFSLVFIPLIIFFVIFFVFALDTTYKKNIKQFKQDQPAAQQYTLNQSDPIWFYKPDEIGWTKGEVVYLWGYHPVIHSKNLKKTFKFHEVEWMVGND